MKHFINLKSLIVLFGILIVSETISAQIQWSEWKQITEDSKISYRIAFAKMDEASHQHGYYVEFKNSNNSRVWFNFSLSKSNAEKESTNKVTLKPSSSSLVGIHYTDITDTNLLSVKISDVRTED